MLKPFDTVKKNEVFHFKNSLRPFIKLNETLIYDFNSGITYYCDDVNFLNDLKLYPNDEVEVDGHLEWVE